MTNKFKNLKESIRDLEEESGVVEKRYKAKGSPPSFVRRATQYLLLGAFILTFLLYAGRQYEFQIFTPFQTLTQSIAGHSQSLLDGMGRMLEEMGYGTLTHEELTELRAEGVTATYVMRVRELGYEDLTLEDAVRLQNAGVSTTFMTMMQELGYRDLTIDDYIRLRRNNVTAHFTSNMHDMGFQDLTIEELIRLREVGVTANLVELLLEDSENILTLEEIIRYRISNQ